jgi:hypothetical protein
MRVTVIATASENRAKLKDIYRAGLCRSARARADAFPIMDGQLLGAEVLQHASLSGDSRCMAMGASEMPAASRPLD